MLNQTLKVKDKKLAQVNNTANSTKPAPKPEPAHEKTMEELIDEGRSLGEI